MRQKKMIGISTYDFDLGGARMLRLVPDAMEQNYTGMRRASRTRTLDGGAVVYDAGFAEADLTWNISVVVTSVYVVRYLEYLVRLYNSIRICTDDGVFSAVPASWRMHNGIATLEAWVTERIV
jgi:hypothetical protein